MRDITRRMEIVAAVLLGLGAAAGQASAAQGFYIGADISSTSVDLDDIELVDDPEFEGTVKGPDKTAFGYGLTAGYRFSPYLAVEATYLDPGDFSLLAIEEGDERLGVKLASRGPAVSLLAAWPITSMWSLEGRVGAYFSKSKLKASLTEDGSTVDASTDTGSRTSLLLGAGIVGSPGEHWGVRLGYDWLDTAAQVSIDGMESAWKKGGSRLSLGVRYSF